LVLALSPTGTLHPSVLGGEDLRSSRSGLLRSMEALFPLGCGASRTNFRVYEETLLELRAQLAQHGVDNRIDSGETGQ